MAAGSALSERKSSRFVLGLVHFERMCQLTVLLIGAHCAFAGGNLPIGPDGLAYLDVARAYLHHNWNIAANGYWGPCVLLAAGDWGAHFSSGH
jgi:hypothetical protein